MPLTKCRACGKEISTEATACPSCGHPMAKLVAKRTPKWGCLVVILVIIGSVTWVVVTDYKSGGDNDVFDINKPETITGIIHEATAYPTATLRNGRLSLTYSIDPWL